MRFTSAFLVLLLAFSTNAQDKIELEGKKTATIGYMHKIKIVQLPGDDVKIKCTPENDDWLAAQDISSGQKTVIFVPGLQTLKASEQSKVFTFIFASNKDKKTLLETFEVTVSREGATPPPPGGGNPPPKDPPVVVTKYNLMVVRANTNANPAFTAFMKLPEWEALKAAGHKVSEATLEEATEAGAVIPNGTVMPFVLKLLIAEDGKSQTQKGIVKFPTQSEIPNLVK